MLNFLEHSLAAMSVHANAHTRISGQLSVWQALDDWFT